VLSRLKRDDYLNRALVWICFLVMLGPFGSGLQAFAGGSVSQSTVNWSVHPMFQIQPALANSPSGLSPDKIRAAYNLPSTGGSGTIAIVDAYDDPTALSDLTVFSSQFGLPFPNFEKHTMSSGVPENDSWAVEISLDVQWAHAIAPNAKILLVEANSETSLDLLAGVDYARGRSDVVAVSMSWGSSEFAKQLSYDSHFTSAFGAAFFASAGDSGANVSWPASSPGVVGVGGTRLVFDGNGSFSSETAWSGSGGGVSSLESEPNYQSTYGIPESNGKRVTPDVSYNADPVSGVSVYDDTPYQGSTGWRIVGGTSAGPPQWAAIQSLGLSASNDNLYRDAKTAGYPFYFRDVTKGSNGNPAKAGYDLVTGLGSPLTLNFAQSTMPPNITVLSPSNQVYNNNSVPLTYTIASYAPVVWTGFSLDGKMNTTVTGNSTITGLSEGSHSVIVYANDAFGNVGSSGNISFQVQTSIHDIAVSSINVSKTIVGRGYDCNITVTVINLGDFQETFNVTVYAGAITLQNQTLTLENGTSTNFTVVWNTAAFAYGNYTISAFAWPVLNETNIANNNFTAGVIRLCIPGDINGDGSVDIYDAILLAGAYYSKPGNLNWNSNADINGDNIVDIYDAIIVAKYYGQRLT